MAAFVDRLYERYRSRYYAIWGYTVLAVSMLSALVAMTAYDRYVGVPAERFWLMAAISEAGLAAAFFLGGFKLARDHTGVRAWIRDGPDSSQAAAVWSKAATLPRVAVAQFAPFASVGAIAWLVAAVALGDDSAEGIAFALVGLALTVAVLLGIAHLVLSVAIRPVLSDASAHLPPDHAQAFPGRIGRTLMASLVSFVFIGGALVAAVATEPGGGSGDGLQMIAITAVVAATIGALVSIVFTEVIVGPIRALTGGADRVAGGDTQTRVPTLAHDELGRLTARFNAMVARLDEQSSDLRESRARIVTAADAARREVERNLHDGAQQHLVVVRLKLGQIERLAARGDPGTIGLIEEARADLVTALSELRDLAHGIYPAILESDGLPGALDDALRRTKMPYELSCDGAGRYALELETAVYFCCLEALQNAGKHAGDGARLEVRLEERDGALRFTVADDGAGFGRAEARTGAGLRNMTDRIGALGGTLEISSQPGRGTRVDGTLPAARAG